MPEKNPDLGPDTAASDEIQDRLASAGQIQVSGSVMSEYSDDR